MTYSKTQNMKKKNLTKIVGLMAAAAMCMTTSAQAALSIDDVGVVGTVAPGLPSGAAEEVSYINHLLTLGANTAPSVFDGQTYDTGAQIGVPLLANRNFVTVNSGKDETGNLNVPAGFEYVYAKYGGGQGNGGGVLYYLGGAAFALEATHSGIFSGRGDNGLSHFSVFNPMVEEITPVPEPATVVAGALLLLPFAASTFRILRKKRAA